MAAITALLVYALGTGVPAFGPPSATQVHPRCFSCGSIIIGGFYEVEGRFYHPEHFLCNICSQPIRDAYVTVDQRLYHSSCYQKRFAVICVVCNRPIEEAYERDYWGNAYHRVHLDREVKCDFCGRLIVGGFAAGRRRFEDGRQLCGQCAATAVMTTQAAEKLMLRVARYLEMDGVHEDADSVVLLLLYRDKLQKLSPDPVRHLNGFTDFASPLHPDGRAVFSSANICLLHGMPEVQMTAVLAHELMHVWQARRNVLVSNDALREGSANYAQYLVMKRVDTPEARFIIHGLMNDDDPAYGEGFRRVKRYVDDHGVEAWLKLASTGSVVKLDDR